MKKLLLILFVFSFIGVQGQTPNITKVDEEINDYIFSGSLLFQNGNKKG